MNEQGNNCMVDMKYKWYLYDLGFLIKELAIEIKNGVNTLKPGTSEYDFETGKLLAFHRIISLMQQQAKAFQIDMKDLRLEDIDPDKDLT
jgi:hypothetical protein